MSRKKRISSEQLDKKFDEGVEDELEHFDTENIQRPNAIQRISLDLPEWMLRLIDTEATRLGIPRQAVIKVIIDDSFRNIAALTLLLAKSLPLPTGILGKSQPTHPLGDLDRSN